MSWPEVHLNDVASTITKGTTPKTLGYSYANSGIPFLRAENLRNGSLEAGQETLFIDQETHQHLARSSIQPNDVLISIAGTIGRVGLVPATAEPMNCNQAVAIVRLANGLQPRFLMYWLMSDEAKYQMSGAKVTLTIPNLSLGQIGRFAVPLPAPSEQCRIVEILDKTDALRKRAREADAKTARILPALFLKMFGDPATNPMGWPVVPLAKVIARVEAGWSAQSEARWRKTGEFGVLKVSAVTSGVFLPQEHKAVASIPDGRNLVIPKRGDLLFSRANTRELVAATCLVEDDHPQLFLSDKLWRLVPHEGSATTPYLRELLAFDAIRDRFRASSSGSSGSMLNVSQDAVLRTEVPIPPFTVQKRFEDRTWKVLTVRRDIKTAATALETIRALLFQRAFCGQLTAKWREAHMQELLAETQEQARLLNLPAPN